jgi:hypothetical protein
MKIDNDKSEVTTQTGATNLALTRGITMLERRKHSMHSAMPTTSRGINEKELDRSMMVDNSFTGLVGEMSVPAEKKSSSYFQREQYSGPIGSRNYYPDANRQRKSVRIQMPENNHRSRTRDLTTSEQEKSDNRSRVVPKLAYCTSFAASCLKIPESSKQRIIIPWDHNTKSYTTEKLSPELIRASPISLPQMQLQIASEIQNESSYNPVSLHQKVNVVLLFILLPLLVVSLGATICLYFFMPSLGISTVMLVCVAGAVLVLLLVLKVLYFVSVVRSNSLANRKGQMLNDHLVELEHKKLRGTGWGIRAGKDGAWIQIGKEESLTNFYKLKENPPSLIISGPINEPGVPIGESPVYSTNKRVSSYGELSRIPMNEMSFRENNFSASRGSGRVNSIVLVNEIHDSPHTPKNLSSKPQSSALLQVQQKPTSQAQLEANQKQSQNVLDVFSSFAYQSFSKPQELEKKQKSEQSSSNLPSINSVSINVEKKPEEKKLAINLMKNDETQIAEAQKTNHQPKDRVRKPRKADFPVHDEIEPTKASQNKVVGRENQKRDKSSTDAVYEIPVMDLKIEVPPPTSQYNSSARSEDHQIQVEEQKPAESAFSKAVQKAAEAKVALPIEFYYPSSGVLDRDSPSDFLARILNKKVSSSNNLPTVI